MVQITEKTISIPEIIEDYKDSDQFDQQELDIIEEILVHMDSELPRSHCDDTISESEFQDAFNAEGDGVVNGSDALEILYGFSFMPTLFVERDISSELYEQLTQDIAPEATEPAIQDYIDGQNKPFKDIGLIFSLVSYLQSENLLGNQFISTELSFTSGGEEKSTHSTLEESTKPSRSILQELENNPKDRRYTKDQKDILIDKAYAQIETLPEAYPNPKTNPDVDTEDFAEKWRKKSEELGKEFIKLVEQHSNPDIAYELLEMVVQRGEDSGIAEFFTSYFYCDLVEDFNKNLKERDVIQEVFDELGIEPNMQ